MTEKRQRQFGLWDSPITPTSLAGDLRLGDVQWDSRGGLVWSEGRSGTGVLVVREHEHDAARDLTSDLSVRAEVGYGGGDFTVHEGAVYFVVHKTGRIFRQEIAGGRAAPITPAWGKAASPIVSPHGLWVAFVHHDTERVDRIGVVDSEGRHWPRILAEGHDFYMQPRWSPDGGHLAWVAWDHPEMPWDGTVIEVGRVTSGADGLPVLEDIRVVAGGSDVAVFQPEFTPDGRSLVYVSDETGWGHLWRHDLKSGKRAQLTDGKAEYGVPAWAQGMRTFAMGADGRHVIGARSEGGFTSLERIDLDSGKRTALEGAAAYTDVAQPSVAPEGRLVAFVASAATTPPRIVVHDLESGDTRVVARSSSESVPAGALATPEALSWETTGGETAHGIYYAPASSKFEGTGKPPLVVLVHGGPTGQARAAWSAQSQFFATRGFAVLTVNYRGSTGYGREYMLRLRSDWGICDVDDAISGMQALARDGRIDAARTAIMGGSAGGFTVLQAMVTSPEAFAAGVCLFGVSNQFHLAAETHKFEERYLDSLLGPLPESAKIYRERSPIFHADRIRRPLAVFQGEIDQVVPRSQSDTIVEALKRTGTPHVYHVYEGEGHGWRKRETIEHFYRTVEQFLRQHLIYS